jgi:predicted aminopeptidase
MKKRRFSLPIHLLSANRLTKPPLFHRRLARVMLSLTVAFHVTGCSPGYVVRAAYEQSKILLARRPLDEVIADPKTSADERLKLEFVREARAFGADIGLRPKGSFTAYADIGKDTLAWIVVASRRDSFNLYTWWFPIVGTVPYKGFFNLEDAQKQATYLEQNGYESSVRGTEAFSTLGWFNDPLLSTTLKNPAFRIVNTVLHESVHSTIWIKDNVPFNETLASFVGGQATIEFFSRRLATISKDTKLRPELESSLRAAEQDQQFQSEFAAVLSKLYQGLTALYSDSNLSSAQKIEKRVAVFETHIGPFRRKYPRMSALKTINNAEILQFTIYMTKLELFEALFARSGRSWSTFFSHIAAVKQAVEQDSSKDPWKALERIVHSEVL